MTRVTLGIIVSALIAVALSASEPEQDKRWVARACEENRCTTVPGTFRTFRNCSLAEPGAVCSVQK